MSLKHKNRTVCFIGIVGTGIAVDSWGIFAKPNPVTPLATGQKPAQGPLNEQGGAFDTNRCVRADGSQEVQNAHWLW